MLFFSIALALDVPKDAPEPSLTEDPAAAEATGGPDRSRPPEVLAPTPVDLDDLTTVELGPGLKLHHVRIPRLRDVNVSITWWKGIGDLDAPPEVANLFSAQWGKATEAYDEEELAAIQERLDLEISSYVSAYESNVELEGPLDQLETGLDLLAEVVHRPVFDKRALTLTQENLNRWYTITGPTDPNTVLFQAIDYAWYPADHPLARRPDLERFQSTKATELAPVHARLLEQGPVDIVVVGDIELAAVQAKIASRFGTLGAQAERAEQVPYDPPPSGRVIAIPMRESKQISILHKRPAPAYGHEDETAMDVLQYALGGHFLARFNKNLREDKGWTYGVGAWYGASDVGGSYNISVDVPADKMAPAVTELNRELQTLVDEGVTPEEIDAGWRSAMKRYNDTRSTTSRAAGVYGWLLDRRRDIAERLERTNGLRAITPEQTREAAGRYLAADQGIWLFLGPREGLESGFEALGLEPVWVEPEDAILGHFDGP